jgi:hypothetical protein
MGRAREKASAAAEEPQELEDPDAAVFAQFTSRSRLTEPHTVEFFLYFPSERNALKAANQIRSRSFDVKVERAAQGDSWLCFATKSMPLQLDNLRQVRSDFTKLANSLDGEYDGWGTAVDK